MAVYFVTGKLGSGKTLSAVYKIKDYLMKGRKVATNLNISLTGMFGYYAKNVNLIRVPDKPSSFDLECIGRGNSTYDESLNGLLVLDECGTWFNSRSWADKNRQDLINWIAHARKLGWDVIFLVQNLHVVDKQSRLMFAEHVVYCRRLDRLRLPFIHGILKLITFGAFSLPKIHVSIVKYGDSPTSLTVDKWIYQGSPLYAAYDTKQQFSDFYNHGAYSLLPPSYYSGSKVKFGLSFIMRLTKIYFKRSKRLYLILLGIAICLVSQYFYNKYFSQKDTNLQNSLSNLKIESYFKHGNNYRYTFSSDNKLFSSSDLQKSGIEISSVSPCKANLIEKGVIYEITCK
ncbi:zonular occludens toxin domain-containing protein [Providencia huaxiensis]|uniref:zonular occludens toxin domain-containing protein n=1 Tax=Providencia huaxiensis TaxID=2027290 RepID=UPI0037582F10